jgi:hypothetical protein
VTISGNRAGIHGGGLFNDGGYAWNYYGGKFACQNCTITRNRAGGLGGGVAFDLLNSGPSRMANSVVGGNAARHFLDCSGLIDSLGYNLFQDDAGCFIVGDTTGNILGEDPQLQPLADNGGPTLTHLPGAALREQADPLAPSDQGSPRCPLTDQRGERRPGGGRRCDIGAVEFVCRYPTRTSSTASAAQRADESGREPRCAPGEGGARVVLETLDRRFIE